MPEEKLGFSEEEIRQIIQDSDKYNLIAQLKAIFLAYGDKEAQRLIYLREIRKILKPLR